MAEGGEIFTLEELRHLSGIQLAKVCEYLGIKIPPKAPRRYMIEMILDFQKPKGVYETTQAEPQRSVRVLRIYQSQRQE